MQGTALRAQDEKPNIIWITCEDISPYMSVYGDRVVSTPNIDRLAGEGMRFQSVYTTAGVSAPSRSFSAPSRSFTPSRSGGGRSFGGRR